MSLEDGLWARTINMILGGWLFVSAFVWNHSAIERVNVAYVGSLIFVSSLLAVSKTRARYMTGLLATKMRDPT